MKATALMDEFLKSVPNGVTRVDKLSAVFETTLLTLGAEEGPQVFATAITVTAAAVLGALLEKKLLQEDFAITLTGVVREHVDEVLAERRASGAH